VAPPDRRLARPLRGRRPLSTRPAELYTQWKEST
jgi:hypothetical protein